MASLNFLEYLPGYVNSTRGETLAHRRDLLPRLDENYNLHGRKARQLVFDEMKQTRPALTRDMFNRNVALYRNAYLYLHGSQEERARVAGLAGKEEVEAEYVGVFYLIMEGIENWEDMLKRVKETKTGGEEQPVVESAESVRPIALPEAVMAKINEAAGILTGAFSDLLTEVERLRLENQDQRELVSSLNGRVAYLETELAQKRAMTLQEIASLYPHVPELWRIAERVRLDLKKGNGADQLAWLPKSAPAFNNIPVSHSPAFADRYAGLQPGEKKQVEKQVNFLAVHGGDYRSLDTKPAPSSAKESGVSALVSRASRDLRFTWKNRGGELYLYGLYHHTELYPSEQ